MDRYPVVHFELPYEDRDRAAEFYARAFGWGVQKLGPELGDYVVVTTGEVDPVTQRPSEPGVINGGLFRRNDPAQQPSVVVAVDDIHAAMGRVEMAGGEILGGVVPGEPDDIPGVGLYCAVRDSEGNRLGLLEAAARPANA